MASNERARHFQNETLQLSAFPFHALPGKLYLWIARRTPVDTGNVEDNVPTELYGKTAAMLMRVYAQGAKFSRDQDYGQNRNDHGLLGPRPVLPIRKRHI